MDRSGPFYLSHTADRILKGSRTALKKYWIKGLFAVLLIGVLAAAATALFRQSTAVSQRTTVAMGSVVNQTVYGTNANAAQQTAIHAARAIQQLENRISCKLENTEIAELNRTRIATVSDDTAALLTQLLALQRDSMGKYCITVRTLTQLWDFDAANFTVPDPVRLAEAVNQSVGTECTVNGNTVQLTGAGEIDLGSAGKGAACDAAAAVYRAEGCTAAVIAVGGSVGLYGQKPDGSEWSVAVRDPDGSSDDTLGQLSLTQGFISTSGTYEKTREADGVSYHHLLDPATGCPATTDLVSATVVCDSGALSDALATACVVLGAEKGAALLKQYGAEYIFIDTGHRITVSDGLRDRFVCTSDAYTVQTNR